MNYNKEIRVKDTRRQPSLYLDLNYQSGDQIIVFSRPLDSSSNRGGDDLMAIFYYLYLVFKFNYFFRNFDISQIYLVHVCCGLVRVPQEIKQHVGTLVRTKQEKKKHPYDSSFLHLRIKTVVTCMEMQGGKCYSLQFGDVIPQIVVVFFVTFYAFDVYCCSWVGLCYVGCLEWPP